MDFRDLEALVTDLRSEGGDLPEVEVKRASGGFPQSLAPTLSAFANTPGGGTILLGFDEGSGFAAVGVYDGRKCQTALASSARSALDPPVTFTSSSMDFEDKQIVVAEIHELSPSAKPCRVKSTGKAYLRSYDGDYELSQVEEQAFVANRATPRFDAEPVTGASASDFDLPLVDAYVDACQSSSSALARMTRDEVLYRTGVVVTEDRVPSVAGLLALATYPQQFFPNLVIQASVAATASDPPGTRALDPQRFDGPIPLMLDQALRWVQRNTKRRVRFFPDGHGRDEPEYPAEAVRELIANALVHRDLGPYALGEAITLRVLPEQLILSNPGGLWGITASRLGQAGVTSARNGYLVRICQNVRFSGDRRVCEALASGIPTVLHALSDAGMVPPRFHDQGIRFTVRVPNHTLLAPDDLAWLATVEVDTPLNDIQRHALVAMRHGANWTNKSFRDAFPVDSRDARRMLMELVDLGLAEAHGERGGRSYRLAPAVPSETTRDDRRDTRRTRANSMTEVRRVLAEGAATLDALSKATGLSARQVEYALRGLRDQGEVVLVGGRGHAKSRYALTSSQLSLDGST